jgi:hypothetical protein
MDWDWESEHSNPNKRDPNHELASSFSEEEVGNILLQIALKSIWRETNSTFSS